MSEKIGQDLKNTHEGLSFKEPLFGHTAPSGVKKKKRDTGRTAIDIARESLAKATAAKEANEQADLEKNGPVEGTETENEENEVEFSSLDEIGDDEK